MHEWRSTVQSALRATEANLLYGHAGSSAPLPPSTYVPYGSSSGTGGHPSPSGGAKTDGSLLGAAGMLRQLGESVNALRAQGRSHAAELDLERTVREDSVKELAKRMHHEQGEMREIVKQLRSDNAELRKSVFDVERRPHQTQSSVSHLAGGGSSSGGAGSDVVTALLGRVSDLEAMVTRHQQTIADRSRRHDVMIQELVVSTVQHETERMRSIAREAARDSTEDLVKLRMQSVSAMVTAELDRVSSLYHQAAASAVESEKRVLAERDERAQQFVNVHQKLALAMEGRDKWDKLQFEVRELVRSQLESERTRLEDLGASLRTEVTAMMKTRHASDTLELQHYITQRLETIAVQSISKEDVQRLLQNSSATTETELGVTRKSLHSTRVLLDDTRQEMQKLFGSLDGQIADTRRSVDEVAHARTLDLQLLQRLQVDGEDTRAKLRPAVARVEEVAMSVQEHAVAMANLTQSLRHAQEETKRHVASLADQDLSLARRIDQAADDAVRRAAAHTQTASDATAAQLAEYAKSQTALEGALTQRFVVVNQSIAEVRAAGQTKTREVVAEELQDLKNVLHDQRSQIHEAEQATRGLQLRFQEHRDSLTRELEEDRAAQRDSHKQLAATLSEKVAGLRRAVAEEIVAPAVAEVAKEVTLVRERVGKVSAATLDVPHLAARLDEVTSQVKDAAAKADDANHKLRVQFDRSAMDNANALKSKLDALRDELLLAMSRGDQTAEERALSQVPAVARRISEETASGLSRQLRTAAEADQSVAVADVDERLTADVSRMRVDVTRVSNSLSRLQVDGDTRHDEAMAFCRELQSRLNEMDGRVTTAVVHARSAPTLATAGQSSSPAASGPATAAALAPLEQAVKAVRDELALLRSRQNTCDEKLLVLQQSTFTATTKTFASSSASSPVAPAGTAAATHYDYDSGDRVGDETIALTVEDVHQSVAILIDQKLEIVQDSLEDIRITVEEAIAGLRVGIADLTRHLEDSVLRVVQTLRSMDGEHDAADANEITVLADVFSVLLARSKGSDETIAMLSDNFIGTVDLVQQHERGFESVRQLAEAIAFNAQNIVTLAETCGLDRSAFTLKLNYDSFGDSTDDHATSATNANNTTTGGSDS